jgi:ATP-dependent DNA helicase RecQ
MPTGMGKSLCYQVPALAQDGLTLVISPLIALMKDQVDRLRARGIDASFINASLDRREREARQDALAAGAFKLLYVTPERFRKPEFVALVRARKVDLLAVDEAHCISQWGHDFRPDYTRLREIREVLGLPTTIALTATATPRVQQDIIGQLGLEPAEVAIFHEGIARPNLHLGVRAVLGDGEKLDAIIAMRERERGNAIAYFALIKTLSWFSDQLLARGVRHLVYHGDLGKNERRQIQNDFMRGEGNLVLATNAFGMGIDKDNIRVILHAEVPGAMESYYQEIGRAGRDAKDAQCTLLYDEHDLLIQMDFIRWNNPGAEYYVRLHDVLAHEIERANAFGLEWLKERLQDRNRHDFRLEVALGILERHGVIEGDLDGKDLTLLGALPDALRDEAQLEEKRRREQERLYTMVKYAKLTTCRNAFIHDYFGLPHAERCGSCDVCMGKSA